MPKSLSPYLLSPCPAIFMPSPFLTRPTSVLHAAEHDRAQQTQVEAKRVEAKRALARHALDHHLEADMTLGLGSGTTAETFIRTLAEDATKRPRLCIASSQASHRLAASLNLPVVSPAAFFAKFAKDGVSPARMLDVTIDGTDALDSHLRLVKGGGGCLLREKILAQNSRSMLVLAEERKLTPCLGIFPLPVEIDPFAWQLTARAVDALFERTLERPGKVALRGGISAPSLSDGGHYTLDCAWGKWNDDSAERLAASLCEIAGVVEHGLFVREASLCLLAHPTSERIAVRELRHPAPSHPAPSHPALS